MKTTSNTRKYFLKFITARDDQNKHKFTLKIFFSWNMVTTTKKPEHTKERCRAWTRIRIAIELQPKWPKSLFLNDAYSRKWRRKIRYLNQTNFKQLK